MRSRGGGHHDLLKPESHFRPPQPYVSLADLTSRHQPQQDRGRAAEAALCPTARREGLEPPRPERGRGDTLAELGGGHWKTCSMGWVKMYYPLVTAPSPRKTAPQALMHFGVPLSAWPKYFWTEATTGISGTARRPSRPNRDVQPNTGVTPLRPRRPSRPRWAPTRSPPSVSPLGTPKAPGRAAPSTEAGRPAPANALLSRQYRADGGAIQSPPKVAYCQSPASSKPP